MDEQSLISEGLYRHVNRIVGSEDVVRMRRMVMDLQHEICHFKYNSNPACEAVYLSGSTAEGLRFSSSDVDRMIVIRGIRAIFSASQLPRCNNTTVLSAECDGVRPGFTLLRLITRTTDPFLTHSCVQQNSGFYISSSLWRTLPVFNASSGAWNFMYIHGPCTSGVAGNTEVDLAHCIKSCTWPNAAFGCIRRLQQLGWPKHGVLKNMIEEGCLFVPIGSRDSPFETLEWRISFSLAEKTLVHNMTHSQFLVYALLKIFLKEAIDVNQEVKGLLCSYFLKTVLFWKITQPDAHLSEENFLRTFWKCFEMLITYVISGNCPNFFIPENNMFRGKIEGQAQRKLLSHLTFLYHKGYSCLLQCPSLQDAMSLILRQPIIAFMLPDDQNSATTTILDIEFINEISNSSILLSKDQHENVTFLHHAELILCNIVCDQQQFVLKFWMKMFLPEFCVAMSKTIFSRDGVPCKVRYNAERLIIKVIMHSSCDTARHLLYSSLVLYHFGHYTVAIKLLERGKRRLQNPSLMYPWNFDEDKFRTAGGDTTPLSDMMKTVVAFPVSLTLASCIPGLELEHEAAGRHSTDLLIIPSLVTTNFILFLCYLNKQDIERTTAILHELSTLLHYDEGYHISERDRAISWQLLGICQEISGDYKGAINSYNTAMQQRWCQIKSASGRRIRNLCPTTSKLYKTKTMR